MSSGTSNPTTLFCTCYGIVSYVIVAAWHSCMAESRSSTF